MGNYVLAMYDIRGKQEYIFRSRHIKEIMGGSAVIEDCFKDYLYPQAKEYRNRRYGKDGCGDDAIFNHTDQSFSVKAFEERMNGEQFIGEVVYDGGGNFFVLYKDRETCIEINKLFTRRVLEETATLKVLCTYNEVTLENYVKDRDKLYEKHRVYEARESAALPAQTLPFTQVDYLTSMPLCKLIKNSEDPSEAPQKVSRESYCKYKKYKERYGDNDKQGEIQLDNLVTKKGVDSHLAIIYIDGNNMGAKVQQRLGGKTDYDTCVNLLRDFSKEIQRTYVDERMAAIDAHFENHKKYQRKAEKHRRFVVAAGDEINFICNASDAYDVVKAYFEGMPKEHSACAGIAIFHSHAPYYDAYRIAEECCESGKRLMKSKKLENVNLMDVHYCQGGIGTDLDTIRKHEVGNLISKPWFIAFPESKQSDGAIGDVQVDQLLSTWNIPGRTKTKASKNEKSKKSGSSIDYAQYIDCKQIDDMARDLNKLGHSNVKMLAEHAKNSLSNLRMELERIKAHSSQAADLDNTRIFSLLKETDKDKQQRLRAMIYDIVILYDLWFYNEEDAEREDADE